MRLFLFPLVCAVLAAQGLRDADLARMTRELRSAVGADSFGSAAELADKLDHAVQQRYRAWLIRDAEQSVSEVLTWLPSDIEGFWVNQTPFTIKPDEPLPLLYDRPIQVYSMDRLVALDDGKFQKALANITVRIVASAVRNLSAAKDGFVIPGVPHSEEVAYFYFFADPVVFPAADESIQGRPAWKATAKIFVDGPSRPREEPPKKDDDNWLVLARPDMLVLSNRRGLLSEILQSITTGSKTRALPTDLPEWAHVDRTASFWGLRHYSARSKPTREMRGYAAAELPAPDGAATGVTVRFNEAKQTLEIQYLSMGPLSENLVFARNREREFKVDQPEVGVWRLISDVQARGPFPVHFAMTMLGFGMYR